MRSTFFGIEVARRALFAGQRALDVTGHNIANANTPGYSRQVATQVATDPLYVPALNRPAGAGQIGTGVAVDRIERMRDQFLEQRMRQEQQTTGRWSARRDSLAQVELMLNEPSESGIRSSLDLYWQSLQELSKNPENEAVRTLVAERAQLLGDSLQHSSRQLEQLRLDVDAAIEVNVDRVNTLSQRIATLNIQIGKVVSMGDQPNDLLDERDRLTSELSTLLDITVVDRGRGQISVAAGGFSLVEGEKGYNLTVIQDVVPDGGGSGTRLGRITWADSGTTVSLRGGAIQGQLEVRDELVPSWTAKLDELASAIITETNNIHQQGFDLNGLPGGVFFVGTSARDIAVIPSIIQDVSRIAASRSGAPGDGSNATALAQLKQAPVLANGTASISDFFHSLVSTLGVDSQQAKRMTENQELLLDHLRGRQSEVAGVSLDEEMADLIRFQHSYGAAARAMTSVDQILEIVIEKMGLVGR